MDLTLEQVTELAPDARSAAAGRKLMAKRNWQDLGCHATALWGRCRGSALYEVRVDLQDFGYSCSCPSRKFPCKHVLGRLMLQAASPDTVEQAEPPEWVEDWLTRRRGRLEKAAAREAEAERPRRRPAADSRARARRAAQRVARVQDGLERLDLWLNDLIRHGLAELETRSQRDWDETAQRLVDAQAPGLASWIRRLSTLIGAGSDWPARLLSELGRLKLVLQAWSQREQLSPELQADLKQVIGWTVGREELAESGETVVDEWMVYGQRVEEDDRLRTQRSWAVGRETGRTALLLQFAPGNAAFSEQILAGSCQRAELVFYPGVCPQRARYARRDGEVQPIRERVSGWGTIDGFLESVGTQLARQPWISTFGCVLHDVQLAKHESDWLILDRESAFLRLHGHEHWTALAISGGRPCDITGEWNGHRLRLLGIRTDDKLHVIS